MALTDEEQAELDDSEAAASDLTDEDLSDDETEDYDETGDDEVDAEEDDPVNQSELVNLVEETEQLLGGLCSDVSSIKNCLRQATDLLPEEENFALIEQARFRLDDIVTAIKSFDLYFSSKLRDTWLNKA